MMKLYELPEDILINIFRKINPLQLIDISKTNSQMYKIIQNIVFKKILVINSKPISQYNNNDNFFAYIFDSYIIGDINLLGMIFTENNKNYTIVNMNSQFIMHSAQIEKGKYIFLYTGISADSYNKNIYLKCKPIIIRNFNTTNTHSR
jgi:hypothetical protein